MVKDNINRVKGRRGAGLRVNGLENVRVRLPSGRSISIVDLFKFCYQLSETDIVVLTALMRNKNTTVEELSERLGLNRSSVSRSLLKLLRVGLVRRVRETGKRRAGRPKYIYAPIGMEELERKVLDDLRESISAAEKLISTLRFQIMGTEEA